MTEIVKINPFRTTMGRSGTHLRTQCNTTEYNSLIA